jgi:hypothetical protein
MKPAPMRLVPFLIPGLVLALLAPPVWSQCRPGDHLIGEDPNGYYCSTRTCGELDGQLEQDRQALQRLQQNMLDTSAELKEWTSANQRAAAAAYKSALAALRDALAGKMDGLGKDRLAQAEREFARRAPAGARGQRLLEKVRALQSQAARLGEAIDAIKMGQYPLTSLDSAWLEMRDGALKVRRAGESGDRIVRDLQKDPEAAQILRENGVEPVADGIAPAFAGVLARGASVAAFFGPYGYDAAAWETSRRRVVERIRNQDTNLLATCRLSAQLKKTTIELGICKGRFPEDGAVMPDPASCGVRR